MTRFERAAQLWSLLVFAARNQQILSYTTVSQLTGIAPVGVGGCLSPIQKYCKNQKLPLLNALVVNEEEGIPGEGFRGDRYSKNKHGFLSLIGSN
jgi:putative restriction endonuclease